MISAGTRSSFTCLISGNSFLRASVAVMAIGIPSPVVQHNGAAGAVPDYGTAEDTVSRGGAGGSMLDGADRLEGAPLPFEDADDLLDGQALGLGQEPVDERDGGGAQGGEADHDAGQADGVLPDREDLDEGEVGQPVDGGGDRGGLAADRGGERLALERPAGAADADGERGDEEVQPDHDDDQPGGAVQPGQAQGGDQGEDDHPRVSADGQPAAAELVDPAEAEVGGGDVDRGHDRGDFDPGHGGGDQGGVGAGEDRPQQVRPVIQRHVDPGDLLEDEEHADHRQRPQRAGCPAPPPAGGVLGPLDFLSGGAHLLF